MLKKTSTLLLLAVIVLSGCKSSATPADISPDGEQTDLDRPSSDVTESFANDVSVTVESETAESSPVNQSTAEIEKNKKDGTMEPRTVDADVEFVQAVLSADGSWTFSVTVRHPDTGWEDYTNGWDVTTLDGTILKVSASDRFTRLLLHPHENEQPFTRSQSGIVIPERITQVIVRAHDLVDGYGGQVVKIDLSSTSGPSYEVERP
jgi:hypothetical protein